MQNKENTSLSHFGRLRKKADRITAAAILSSTFNINAGCESDPAPKEDNTSELESKLAKVKEEAKQKEDTLKGQISTLESEKTTLEGEKTTKTTAINNLIGFVNALGGKVTAPNQQPANGMAGLHSQTAIAENNCSEAHSVNGPLKTIYEELRLLNTNTAGQELSTLKSAIELFYQKTDIIASYNSTSGNVQALSAPTSGSTSATTVGGLLTHIEGLIASLKAEKTDAETAKTAAEGQFTNYITSIELALGKSASTKPLNDRVTDCNTEINNLKTQSGTPYATVLGEINRLFSSSINIDTDETVNKTALDAYVGNLKAIYDRIPGANAADKNTYLDNLKGQLNKIIDLYKATTDTTKSNVDLTDTSLILSNTIAKLVTDVTNSRASLEYLYDTILAPAAGAEARTKPLGDILTAIQTEETTNKTIETLKDLGVDFLTKVQYYVTDKTLLVKTGGGGASYTNADIPMSVLNTKLTSALGTSGTGNGLLEEAAFYQLSENLLSLTKKLTQAETGQVSTALSASWSLATATASDEKTSRENLLNTFVASRTPIAGPAFLADNHQTVLDFIASFNKCNSTDKLTFVKSVIDKIKGDAVAV